MKNMKAIELNFTPKVAKQYIEDWLKQAEKDKAEDQVIKVLKDVKTLVDIASEALIPAKEIN